MAGLILFKSPSDYKQGSSGTIFLCDFIDLFH